MIDRGKNGEIVNINVFAGFIIVNIDSGENKMFKEEDYEIALSSIIDLFSRDQLDYIEEFLYYNSKTVKKIKDTKPKKLDEGEQLSLF
jgi:hypothetical protein